MSIAPLSVHTAQDSSLTLPLSVIPCRLPLHSLQAVRAWGLGSSGMSSRPGCLLHVHVANEVDLVMQDGVQSLGGLPA